ncbi:hypothetical protein VM636_01625 [Streptomyces sp. SCSIO 75703]|uniref:trypsin-like serine peptidase n=1 Tax=unclassified Streptomyces TaxID=2593676 RepID=UPI0004C12F05|nr:MULTISPECIES: hypothetical protein [unclassified Streptomyces]
MRLLRHVLLSLPAAAMVVLATTAPASAQPERTQDAHGTTASPAVAADGARIDTLGAAEEVEEYWTPERMRNAIPVTPEEPGAGRSSGTAEQPGGPPGSTPAAAPSGEMRAKLVETSVAGKVFFTKPSDGKNYVCSASALNSGSKQMAITAGHCVHEGKGGDWMKNWAYVPQYRNGDKPYGTFVAKQMRTFNGWINDGSFDWDVAMVTTWPQGSDKLVNRTGGNGLSWNYSREQDVTINGYPGNKDNGQLQWYCQGRTSNSGGKLALGCDFGGGSSGGPWMREFSESSGLGQTNGVTSTIDSAGVNRSSYFGDSVKQMFDDQGSVT